MIIPSIDIVDGRAVQLRQGKEFVLDGGDPMERLEEFARVGEVAVVDLDAALGKGDNRELIERMARRAAIRVGGGIRDEETARRYLDAGARSIVIGTMATPEFCSRFPAERLIAAVDAREGRIVDRGWQRETGRDVLQAMRELAPYVGGFLFTQVEHEGGMAGFDRDLVARANAAAGGRRLTVAGGVTTAPEIGELDRAGIDAQVGMALYTGKLSLADAVLATLRPANAELYPTVVCDGQQRALGLVWSNAESIRCALGEARGIYWSRSRNELWRKGETSGATQRLIRVEFDCDRDALRFIVEQAEPGFCHEQRRSCWGEDFSLATLESTIRSRIESPPPGSGTAKLLADPELLAAKLAEEAAELSAAEGAEHAAAELADVLYFGLVELVRRGGALDDVVDELARRHRRVGRRPMEAKPVAPAETEEPAP